MTKVIKPDRSDSTVNWNALSLNIGLVLGIMGLPHVMLRFLTVRDTHAAKQSAVVAIGIFSVFFMMLPGLRLRRAQRGGARRRSWPPTRPATPPARSSRRRSAATRCYALVAGVTIATILAVLAGLAIAASGAVAHDLYTNVLKRGEVDERRQLVVGRIAVVGVAAIAIVLALGAKNLNIAFLANIAFAIGASTTIPAGRGMEADCIGIRQNRGEPEARDATSNGQRPGGIAPAKRRIDLDYAEWGRVVARRVRPEAGSAARRLPVWCCRQAARAALFSSVAVVVRLIRALAETPI